MGDVLEKLRAGAALDEDDTRIPDEGLVLILNELHDTLDGLVFDAYGWPRGLANEDIVARLVALNKERAKEDARGLVRWLRPDDQKARAGIGAPVRPQAARDALELVNGAGREQKPLFLASEAERTAAIMAALAEAAAIAARFRQGRRIVPRVEATLASLVRVGFANSADGRRFMFRRVA